MPWPKKGRRARDPIMGTLASATGYCAECPAPQEEREMIRVIKRYESRKLYDTEESRYISLDDIARWVREGQDVRVIDNATSADVSSQILTQIIHDEGKKGTSFLPTELLHELVRAGERAFSSGVEQVQGRVDRLVQASFDRIGPVRRAREEMSHLRERLSQLEGTLASLEAGQMAPLAALTPSGNGELKPEAREQVEERETAEEAKAAKAPAKTTRSRRTTTRKTAPKKAAPKKTTAKTATAKRATTKTGSGEKAAEGPAKSRARKTTTRKRTTGKTARESASAAEDA